jgi:charged multivesicular body protein 6
LDAPVAYHLLTLYPPLPRAILDLKLQRDKLHQYQRRITVLTDKETSIAKQMLAANDKKRALLALRRKKYQESLLQQTDAQLEQLEALMRNVEFAQIQKDIVYGLQQGTKVLKEIHAELGGIERVEMLMGETADAIAYQNVSYIPHPLSLSFLALVLGPYGERIRWYQWLLTRCL